MLKQIDWPELRQYRTGSDFEPFEFYLSSFANSKEVDLLLGYFSFSAVGVLSLGFAHFIANGGTLRIVANDILSRRDKDTLLYANEPSEHDDLIDLTNLKDIKDRLDPFSTHFFECMAWLVRNNRLQIVLIRPKEKKGIAHFKSGIFRDNVSKVGFSGSCNFTAYGITANLESLEILLDWDDNLAKRKIENLEDTFENIFFHKDDSIEYVPVKNAKLAIEEEFGEKGLEELIKQENSLRSLDSKLPKNSRLTRIIEELAPVESISGPHFPVGTEPRAYQNEAYQNWIFNQYKGVFAMATGTGKTITALNCILQEYIKTSSYNTIILVPSITLLNQWEYEVRQFGFTKITKIGGNNDWENSLAKYTSDYNWGIKDNLILICTYASFTNKRFLKYFLRIQENFIIVADEAHNLGAKKIRKHLAAIKSEKRIGLSATPKRNYDQNGTDALNSFFEDSPPYTFEFNIDKALHLGYLTEYKYFPILVELTENELEDYAVISRQLMKYYDFQNNSFKSDPIVEILLIKRKSIIHKAVNKLQTFKNILSELIRDNNNQYIFTYVPEGYITKDSNQERLINLFLRAAHEVAPQLKTNTYTSEDDDLPGILRGFAEGKINLLFAMKMLDEGIDIPRAEIGIFCSSTGNPRQFIQRRGRLLRKHPSKKFSTLYDMIVIPQFNHITNEIYTFERQLVRSELNRVAYFSSLSLNFYDTKRSLAALCNKYDLSLEQIISDL